MTDKQDIFRYPQRRDAESLRIAVVCARFNAEICEGLLAACTEELRRLGARPANLAIASVPGALEIPLSLQELANSGRVDALIALGAVIRGETYHVEIVANESAAGIQSVQLDSGVPIANGVLTCDTEAQAEARIAEKGRDCARVAVEMAGLLRAIDERQ